MEMMEDLPTSSPCYLIFYLDLLFSDFVRQFYLVVYEPN
jgi:hypothetical protein